MPNRPETLIAFLACASIGAVWSSCAPDMGVSVVLDRLRQTEPKVVFAIDSHSYKGKHHDRCAVVNELLAGLPSVERVVQVAGPLARGREVDWRNRSRWESAVFNDAAPRYERLPFGHPLWILYSSGTTGLPKAMVHSQCGILLTLSGKKMEVPVRKLLLAAELGQVASPDAMQNPASLDFFAEYAEAIPRQ